MGDVNSPDEEHVNCDICMKEIPASEAKNAEASDYVAHFCGLDCYDKWKKKARQDKDSN